MSTIYEALQKTKLESEMQAVLSSQDNMTRDDWIDVGISLTIAFLLAVLIVLHYPQFNNKSENISIAKSSTAVNAAPVSNEAVMSDVPDEAIKPAAPLVQSKTPTVLPIDEAEYKAKHILNGVFVSEEEKVAMINNRFFNLGDNIDGMKIVAIEPDKIKLKSDAGAIELRIAV